MRIPIFPLDNVVLFPRIQVPLYIFEPRYRQMTAAALDGERRIGMAVVQPRHRAEMAGDPPVFPVGCLGRIGRCEPHADGTYHIILEGTSRFRIERELPRTGDRLYRIAEVALLEDSEPEEVPESMRLRVLELMRRALPERAATFHTEHFARLDDATFVNAFCQSLDFQALEKQQLLEANGVRARCDQLVALIEFRLAERTASRAGGPETVH
jgi:Lon protease-like protein